jgi:hypothetical protein
MNAHLFRVVERAGVVIWNMPDTTLGKAFMKYELNTVVLAVAVHGRWIKVQEEYGGFCARWIQVEDEDGKRTLKPYCGSAKLYLVVDPTGATVRDKPTKPRIGATDAEPASNIVSVYKPGQMVLALGSHGPWIQVRKAFDPPGVHYDCGDEWMLAYTPKAGSGRRKQMLSSAPSSPHVLASSSLYGRQSSHGVQNPGLSITGTSPMRLPSVGQQSQSMMRQSRSFQQQSQKNFSRLSKGVNREIEVNSHDQEQEVTHHLQLVDLVCTQEEKAEDIEKEVQEVKKKVCSLCTFHAYSVFGLSHQ